MKMSNILEYFISVDSVRCQCVFCGKCFTLDSPLDIREKHLESEHPQGLAKIKSVAQKDKPSNQGYSNDKGTRKKRSKVWYYFKMNADKTGSICNICSKTLVNNGGSTGNMWSHLTELHNIKKEIYSVTDIKTLKADREILFSKVESPVEYLSEKTPYKSNYSKENQAFFDLQKPFENISEYILKSDIRSTRNISNVRIFCKDGVIPTHKILLASFSKYLSDLFIENTDISDIILPDFNKKDVVLGLENFVSEKDFQTSHEILKLLLGKRQYTAFSNDDLIMEVFDENTIEHDQEERGEKTTSGCSLSKEQLEDHAMSVSGIKATNDEKIYNQKDLMKLQRYFFIFDRFNGSSICKRCGTTFNSNQDLSVMIQHMNNCGHDQNSQILLHNSNNL